MVVRKEVMVVSRQGSIWQSTIQYIATLVFGILLLLILLHHNTHTGRKRGRIVLLCVVVIYERKDLDV